MEHASEISLAGKIFGGLSVEHEVSIFPEQSIHSALTNVHRLSRTYSREKLKSKSLPRDGSQLGSLRASSRCWQSEETCLTFSSNCARTIK